MTNREKVQINLYAAAREAIGSSQIEVEPNSMAEIFSILANGDLEKIQVLARCSVLVDGVRSQDFQRILQGGEQLDILPPFAGGQKV